MTPLSARIVGLDSAGGLVGPPPTESRLDPPSPPDRSGTVTGLRTIARIRSDTGVDGVWIDRDRVATAIEVALDGEPAVPLPGFTWGRGGWVGERATPSGLRIREIGLLSDLTEACVLQWNVAPTPGEPTPPGGDTLSLTVRPGEGSEVATARFPVGAGGRVVAAMIASTTSFEPSRLTPLEGRERQRRSRHRAGGTVQATFHADGAPLPTLEHAISTLEEAPLGDPTRAAPPDLLDGFDADSPRFVELSALGLVGRAALAVGRGALARACLVRLSMAAPLAPVPCLALVADYFAWTADGELVTSIEPSLRKAVRALPAERCDGEATRALAGLVTAVERLGLDALRNAAEARLASLRSRASEPTTLPTVSPETHAPTSPATGPSDIDSAADRAPVRNEPERSTVAAARAVLGLMEPYLGIRPEAAYGRVVLRSRVSAEWRSFVVSDLPIGDGAVRISLLRNGRDFTIRALQPRGRVPFNLACEPWFPASGLLEARIDGESASVQSEEEDHGTRVRFQLPLDAERVMTFSFGRL